MVVARGEAAGSGGAHLGLTWHREATDLSAVAIDAIHLRLGFVLRSSRQPVSVCQAHIIEILQTPQRLFQLLVEIAIKGLCDGGELCSRFIERDGHPGEVHCPARSTRPGGNKATSVPTQVDAMMQSTF